MFPAIIGLGLSAYQAYQGSKDKKDAQGELNAYERSALDNAYKNIQISTVGSDLMKEESQRTTANLTDATRAAGLRGVLGGIPKIQAQNNLANQEARKYLDDQVNKRQYAMAEDETRLRRYREDRDIANIGALSSQVNAGKQDMWNGINGMYQSATSIYNQLPKGENTNESDSNGSPGSSGANIAGSGIESNNMQTSGTRNSRYADFGSSFSAPPQVVSPDFFGGNSNVNNKYHYNF